MTDIEITHEDLASKLNKQAESFTFYSLALDESNDIKDITQLLILIDINDKFEITEEFFAKAQATMEYTHRCCHRWIAKCD